MAVLYLMREELDNIVVLSVDTGSQFPHMLEHIERTCEKLGAELVVLRPETAPEDQPYFSTDIVPIWRSNSTVFASHMNGQPLLSTSDCCALHVIQPMRADVQKNKNVKIGLRGTKEADIPRGLGSTYDPYLDVEWVAPIWAWTDDDVFNYLEEVGADIPAQYLMDRKNDGLDCWSCTGHTMGGKMAAKMRFMAVHYPDKLEALKARHQRVAEIVDQEVARVRSETGYGN